MKKKYLYLRNFIFIIVFSFFSNCDSRKPGPLEDPVFNFLCYSYNFCKEPPRGTKFGLIGDSWTDLIGGIPLIWSMRTHMENTYGYRITGASLAGRQLRDVMSQGLHYSIIDASGPDLKYMILSLSGNDMLFNYPGYSANLASDKAVLMGIIKERLLTVVRSGNIYKKEKWGGGDLIWIIHGYDYLNPDKILLKSDGCRPVFLFKGYPDSLILSDLEESINLLNETLLSATYLEPSLRYVNLRGTLGGPPVSNPDHLVDCIHPNSVGFGILTDVFVRNLDYITGNAR